MDSDLIGLFIVKYASSRRRRRLVDDIDLSHFTRPQLKVRLARSQT